MATLDGGEIMSRASDADDSLIEGGWSDATREWPDDMPDGLRSALRSSFWAGASHMFTILGALVGNEFSDDEGAVVLEILYQELQAEGRRWRRSN